MIVTIVGAGNAGYAHSCKFVEAGHGVRLLKTSHAVHDASFKKVLDNGGIHYIDDTMAGKKVFAKLDMITRDPNEAIPGADVVFVVTQSLQHESVSDRIAPLLEDGQMIMVAPGYLGSVYFRQKSRARDVLFAEGESLPYDARIVEAGAVHILFENVRNPLGFMPVARRDEGLVRARQLLPRFYARDSVLESAFHNPNLIVHTIGTIMSAARIEYSQGEFWMYREAFTPSTWNLIHDLDDEKLAILRMFGLPEQTFADSFQFRTYEDLSADSLTVMKHYAFHGSPKGPDVVNHRYVYEDVPMGLCLMSSLGKRFGVNTPICDSLIHLACSLLKKDFWREGRTVERLGMQHMSQRDIVEYVTR